MVIDKLSRNWYRQGATIVAALGDLIVPPLFDSIALCRKYRSELAQILVLLLHRLEVPSQHS